MRTSEEIYHRVRWDRRFDPARFTLGILVRGAEPKRLPLPSFVPGGDIPWHRVLFVEADGEVVWDRATGVDRLDETSAGRVRSSSRLPSFSARTVSGDATATPGPTLRVLTWNTLWDRHNSELIDTAGRRPLLLAELSRADADVIALQEVEPDLYDMLALEGYATSDGTDVAAHGLVLLSRLPVLEAGHHKLSTHKGVAAMVVRTAAGPVAVLATHLTSDHHPYGPERRVDELSRIVMSAGGHRLSGGADGRLQRRPGRTVGPAGRVVGSTRRRGADVRPVSQPPGGGVVADGTGGAARPGAGAGRAAGRGDAPRHGGTVRVGPLRGGGIAGSLGWVQ